MNLTFLYSGALLALPLAGLPVVLHLLFRRKSPIVLFPTIRFIKASVQRTAARKRVQKWLLLATRIILLALLIGAVAQPARQLTAGWTSAGKSSIAAIVVDTSYSMQLLDHQEPLLSKADAAVRELLRTQLSKAKVAIFRSPPPPQGQPERLRDASELLSEWITLGPQASPRPLVDRIASAVELLDRQDVGSDKWLVVISDFQKREYPNHLPTPKGARIVLIDLHPDDARSAGITRVAIDPAQPTPGTDSEAVVDVAGRPNSSRPVTVSVTNLAGAKVLDGSVQMASIDSAGHSRLRFRMRLPADPWILLKAAFQDEDDMPWDNARTQLIQTPPKQVVSFLGPRPKSDAWQYPVWLALDPHEGGPGPWSLVVKAGNEIAPDANVAVGLLEDWPDDARASRLLGFVRGGGTLVLFIRPGLEETWDKLPKNRMATLTALLPSAPMVAQIAPVNTVSIAAPNDPLLNGFKADWFNGFVVQRLVPFSSDPQGTMILRCFPQNPRPGMRAGGLLYRRPVGAGTVYTIATLPVQGEYSNLALPPVFVPLLVGMCQRPASRSDAQNIELGQPLMLSGRQYEAFDTLTVQGPQNDTTVVKADRSNVGLRNSPSAAASPGLYTWLKPGSNDSMAISNVQLPAGESELFYAPAATVAEPGDNVMVARSVAELQTKVANLGEPEPQWALPIAIVLLLLCVEALMSSLSKLWKPMNLRAFLPGVTGHSP